ncbi:MAG: DUF58 domain-containing protein [Planctomycetota bacterium]
MIKPIQSIFANLFAWFPLSIRGIVAAVGFGVVLIWFGIGQQDYLLSSVTVAGLIVLVLLMLLTLTVALWLKRAKFPTLESINGVGNQSYTTGLVIPALHAVPCVTLKARWLNCSDVEVNFERRRDGLAECVTAKRRVSRDELIRQFEVTDVFGLTSVRWARSFEQAVHIEPMPATTQAIANINRQQDGDDMPHASGKPHGDLIEMRHYRPGDPLKLVLWKHYVRTGQLLVRQPENSIATTSQIIACFVAGPGDEASAGVARSIIGQAAHDGEEIIFQADGSESPTESHTLAIKQIIRSADIGDRGGRVVGQVHKALQKESPQRCIAFVPSRPGPWLKSLVNSRHDVGMEINAIMGVDRSTLTRPNPSLPPWLFERPASDQTTTKQIKTVVTQLANAGITTQVLDRLSGETMALGNDVSS